jgi:hypothetical protein
LAENKKEQLRLVAKEHLPDPIIVIGYLEHQLDLVSQLIVDLSESGVTLSPEAIDRVEKMKVLLNYSSVNFEDIDNPLESYKLPNAEGLKKHTRKVQERYLNAQIREGVFGE